MNGFTATTKPGEVIHPGIPQASGARNPRTHWCIAATVMFLALGVQWREDRYACHLCRGLKEVQKCSFLSAALWRHEGVERSGELQSSHKHDWRRYSYAYSNGLMGCLGKGVGCSSNGLYWDERLGHR